MDLTGYIKDPSQLSAETLFQLRELVARYPYFQTARLLYLQNLFLLHDPTFGQQLRRGAFLVPDRKPLFDMVEGAGYAIDPNATPLPQSVAAATPAEGEPGRTDSLIDGFLAQLGDAPGHPSRGDATTDYTAYLMQLDDADGAETPGERAAMLDEYISNGSQHLELSEEPQYAPTLPAEDADADEVGDDFLTETLARIYVRQGRYEKAAEIIRRINFNYPKKNIYFADQIRFLEKLIVNERNKKQENKKSK